MIFNVRLSTPQPMVHAATDPRLKRRMRSRLPEPNGGTMNNKLLTIRKTGRLTCVWVPTGKIQTPLACVWVEADTFRPTSAAPPSSNDEPGGLRLCA